MFVYVSVYVYARVFSDSVVLSVRLLLFVYVCLSRFCHLSLCVSGHQSACRWLSVSPIVESPFMSFPFFGHSFSMPGSFLSVVLGWVRDSTSWWFCWVSILDYFPARLHFCCPFCSVSSAFTSLHDLHFFLPGHYSFFSTLLRFASMKTCILMLQK